MTFPVNEPCPGSRLRICFQDPSDENRHQGESTRQQDHRLPRSLLLTLTCAHVTRGGGGRVTRFPRSLFLWLCAFPPRWSPTRRASALGFQALPSAPHAYQGRGPLIAEGTGSKQKLLDCETRGNILTVGKMKTWVFHWETGLSLSPGCVPLSLPLRFLAGETLPTFAIPFLPYEDSPHYCGVLGSPVPPLTTL